MKNIIKDISIDNCLKEFQSLDETFIQDDTYLKIKPLSQFLFYKDRIAVIEPESFCWSVMHRSFSSLLVLLKKAMTFKAVYEKSGISKEALENILKRLYLRGILEINGKSNEMPFITSNKKGERFVKIKYKFIDKNRFCKDIIEFENKFKDSLFMLNIINLDNEILSFALKSLPQNFTMEIESCHLENINDIYNQSNKEKPVFISYDPLMQNHDILVKFLQGISENNLKRTYINSYIYDISDIRRNLDLLLRFKFIKVDLHLMQFILGLTINKPEYLHNIYQEIIDNIIVILHFNKHNENRIALKELDIIMSALFQNRGISSCFSKPCGAGSLVLYIDELKKVHKCPFILNIADSAIKSEPVKCRGCVWNRVCPSMCLHGNSYKLCYFIKKLYNNIFWELIDEYV